VLNRSQKDSDADWWRDKGTRGVTSGELTMAVREGCAGRRHSSS